MRTTGGIYRTACRRGLWTRINCLAVLAGAVCLTVSCSRAIDPEGAGTGSGAAMVSLTLSVGNATATKSPSTKSDTGTATNVDTRPDTGATTETDTGAATRPDTKSNVTTDTKTDTKSDAGAMTKAGTRAETEAGTALENYIDIENGNFRIYFFTNGGDGSTDTYLGTFEVEEIGKFIAVDNVDYTSYSILGTVPEAVTGREDFRVMVLANWPDYPDNSDLVVGTTTIDGICTSENYWSKYSYDVTGGAFTLSTTNLIPMYGIQEYTDVKLSEDIATALTAPVNMLRAMARLEVIFEDDSHDYTMDSVNCDGYNEEGYCAPSGVYSTSVGNVTSEHINESGPASEGYSAFTKTKERIKEGSTVTQYETWTAYVPEYGNTADDHACIAIKFSDSMLDEYTIHFRDYDDADWDPEAGPYLDILRNHVYRFRVSVDDSVGQQSWDGQSSPSAGGRLSVSLEVTGGSGGDTE